MQYASMIITYYKTYPGRTATTRSARPASKRSTSNEETFCTCWVCCAWRHRQTAAPSILRYPKSKSTNLSTQLSWFDNHNLSTCTCYFCFTRRLVGSSTNSMYSQVAYHNSDQQTVLSCSDACY